MSGFPKVLLALCASGLVFDDHPVVMGGWERSVPPALNAFFCAYPNHPMASWKIREALAHQICESVRASRADNTSTTPNPAATGAKGFGLLHVDGAEIDYSAQAAAIHRPMFLGSYAETLSEEGKFRPTEFARELGELQQGSPGLTVMLIERKSAKFSYFRGGKLPPQHVYLMEDESEMLCAQAGLTISHNFGMNPEGTEFLADEDPDRHPLPEFANYDKVILVGFAKNPGKAINSTCNQFHEALCRAIRAEKDVQAWLIDENGGQSSRREPIASRYPQEHGEEGKELVLPVYEASHTHVLAHVCQALIGGDDSRLYAEVESFLRKEVWVL